MPLARNVIYLAGLKFGSAEDAPGTWAANAYMPGVICQKYRGSRMVAFSTGAVYGLTPAADGGSRETDPPEPVGEYAMSCLGRERIIQYFSRQHGLPSVLIRLFYACELRYGVLVDLALRVKAGEPIDLSMGCFNIIWQGDSNAMTLRALAHADSPSIALNLTGPETLHIREVAQQLGRFLGKSPVFCGSESGTSCLGNMAHAERILGKPRVSAAQLLVTTAASNCCDCASFCCMTCLVCAV